MNEGIVSATATIVEPAAESSPGARAWNRMWDVFQASKPYMTAVSAEFDLTPQLAHAMRNLSGERAVTMSEFALMLGCDASNVTALADKLESRGWLERRAAAGDRRVKALLLTAAGVALRERLILRMEQAPPAIENLSEGDQIALGDLLERALNSL